MAPSTRLVKSSQVMTRNELADLLEGLAARIRDGAVSLTSGPDTTTLEIPERVNVDVEATSAEKPRGTKLELEIEIDWYPGGADARSGIELA